MSLTDVVPIVRVPFEERKDLPPYFEPFTHRSGKRSPVGTWLTLSQWKVLEAAAAELRFSGRITIRDVARRAGCTINHIAEVFEVLVLGGYLRRHPGKAKAAWSIVRAGAVVKLSGMPE